MTRRTRAAAAFAGLLLLVAAPACGGDDDGEAATPTSSSTTAANGGNDDADAGVAGDAVSIEDFAYQPETLTAKAGTAVTFTNKDGFVHTVTAKDKSYDSGNMEEGATFEHTFAEPGTYEYFCAVHNSMTGSVVVE